MKEVRDALRILRPYYLDSYACKSKETSFMPNVTEKDTIILARRANVRETLDAIFLGYNCTSVDICQGVLQ